MQNKKISVLLPPQGEKGYAIAGEIFAKLWQTVTGRCVGGWFSGRNLRKRRLQMSGSTANTIFWPPHRSIFKQLRGRVPR